MREQIIFTSIISTFPLASWIWMVPVPYETFGILRLFSTEINLSLHVRAVTQEVPESSNHDSKFKIFIFRRMKKVGIRCEVLNFWCKNLFRRKISISIKYFNKIKHRWCLCILIKVVFFTLSNVVVPMNIPISAISLYSLSFLLACNLSRHLFA